MPQLILISYLLNIFPKTHFQKMHLSTGDLITLYLLTKTTLNVNGKL